MQIQYVGIIMNSLSLALTKISVAFLFLDVFVITWFRKATYVVLGAMILQALAMTMTNIFVCTPIHIYWDLEMPSHGCLNSVLKFYIDSGLIFLFDSVLLLLPVPLIWPMKLAWRKRLWLGFLFALGLRCVDRVSQQQFQ